MMRNLIVTVTVAVLMAGFVLAYTALAPAQAQSGMGMADEGVPRFPLVRGYAAGEEIYFIHTAASDEKIARILTEMMDSPVLTVPSLAKAGDQMLADLYVFTNGIQPEGMAGPLGYQPDVFAAPVGTEGYRPLRQVHKVTWLDEDQARVLKSAEAVMEAEEQGLVKNEQTDVVINAPMLTWPDGSR